MYNVVVLSEFHLRIANTRTQGGELSSLVFEVFCKIGISRNHVFHSVLFHGIVTTQVITEKCYKSDQKVKYRAVHCYDQRENIAHYTHYGK